MAEGDGVESGGGRPAAGDLLTLQAFRVLRRLYRTLGGRPHPRSGEIDHVILSGLFDRRAYQGRAGRRFLTLRQAVLHYLTEGEARGLAPGAAFDPVFYRAANPDLAGLDTGLLTHYARHGQGDRRLPKLAFTVVEGQRPFVAGRPTLLIVTHEVSRTGAPILAWNLARQFGADHNVVTLVLDGNGDLMPWFVADSVAVVGPFQRNQRSGGLMRFVAAEIGRRFPLDFAIVNTIESLPVLTGLAAEGVPTVTLIHEIAGSMYTGGKFTEALQLSTQVVFDAELQRTAAHEDWPGITGRNQWIFHQGASDVPPEPPRPEDTPERRAARGKAFAATLRGPGDRPLVLGLGTVSMRKGVDLFVSCAQRVRAKRGPGAARFVWIGHSPKPHPEGHYVDWLADQIKRAGLGEDFAMVGAVDDLGPAYESAALVLSPSRLDPFPNIAMDAALAGVPVLCFENANGFADYLRADPRTRSLSIPYLDVECMAEAVVRLLDDAPARKAAGAALAERSARDFPMALYVERLAPVIASARAITAQEKADIALLAADPTFRADLWLDPFVSCSREEAIRRHVRKAASGQESNQYCRRPALGFVPQTYADHHPALDAAPFENPLAAWIRAGKPAGPWMRPVLIAGSAPPPGPAPGLRVALHLHLFYPDLAEDMLAALAVNTTPIDLFVSTDTAEKAAELEARCAGYARGRVTVAICPNRGRDLGPMLSRFADELQSYDVFGHMHGKRSLALTSVGLSTDLGVVWHEFLRQHLVGDRHPMADLILHRFAARPDLGLVFPDDPNLTGWSLDREIARDLAARMDPGMVLPRSIDFPVGSMFWARPQALAPLFGLRLAFDDYPPEPVPIDGTMLHALERLFPVIATHAGYAIETTHVPGILR